MSTSPPESLKAFSERLASAFIGQDGREILRFLRLTGLLDLRQQASSEGSQQAPPARRIGVWEPSGKDGAYVRAQETASYWGVWAQNHRIPAKGYKRRVVLVGESAARGLFYDPKFNPAQALGAGLERVLGQDSVEVVDLAKSGIFLPQLRVVTESAFDLKPEVIVIFAGNNWQKALHTDADSAGRSARATALREGGLTGLRSFCDRKLANETSQFLTEVAERAQRANVRVVVVVPEFNLRDWRQNPEYPPWLDGVALSQWWECKQRMSAAMGVGDFVTGALLAEHLTALDNGSCATGLYALAECRRRAGRGQEVRGLLERARDVALWDPFFAIYPPGCVQDTLRTESRRLGLSLVDLPEVFEAHLGGEIPDRRLFLDYVHLSLEGIEVSMRATAAAVLPLLGVSGNHAAALRAVVADVAPSVIAEAHLGAAIHNAHYGQSPELVRYHCSQAIGADASVTKMMECIVEMSSRLAPAWVCRATADLAVASTTSLIRLMLGHLALESSLMDQVLRREVVRCFGREFEEKVDALRNREYGGTKRVSSLELPYFSLSSLDEREANWSNNRSHRTIGPDYYLAYRSESAFALIEDVPRDVSFCLTLRVPWLQSGGTVRVVVEVNDQLALETDVGPRWRTARFTVDSQNIRTGPNRIVVRWAAPTSSGSIALKNGADEIERGIIPEYYPVYGEIHSFKAINA